jgi:hypothetical protein
LCTRLEGNPSKDGTAIVSKKNFFAFLALIVSVCSIGLAGASFYHTHYRLNDAELASLHQKVDQLNHERITNAQISEEQRTVLTHTAQEIEHDVERNEKALTASDYATVIQCLDALGITSEEKKMFVDLPDLTTFSGAVPSDTFTVTIVGFKRYFQDASQQYGRFQQNPPLSRCVGQNIVLVELDCRPEC